MDIRKCERYVYIIELFSSHKKDGKFAICDDIDGTWGHYAKLNK